MEKTESYGEKALEDDFLLERHRQILTDGKYKKESINSIYNDWKETNKSGALALEDNFSEDLEEPDQDLKEKAFEEYMELGEKTGQPYPFAAAAVTAKKQGLSEEMYEKAIYKLGENSTGMERMTIEKAYDIEIDEIRDVLNSEETETYPEKELKPAY